MPFAFEKLLIYQKSIALADAVIGATRTFPRGYVILRDQLNQAALSIATNIANGTGRFAVADRREFFGIARGRALACVPLLEVAARCEVIPPDLHTRLRSDLEELCRMVSGAIKRVERREGKPPAPKNAPSTG